MSLTSLDREFFKRAMRSSDAQVKSETTDDITVRCPVCGDSTKSKSKARLHLYGKFDLPLVNCFNGDCPVRNLPLLKFLREYYPSLAKEYRKRQFIENLGAAQQDWERVANEGVEHFKDLLQTVEQSDGNTEIVPHTSQGDNGIPQPQVLFDLSSVFKKAEDVPRALDFLTSRGFNALDLCKQYQLFYSAADIEINGRCYNTSDSIVIPVLCAGRWVGFYSRSTERKSFSTYMPDANSGYKVWNLFGVDLSKPVYVFEGIFDALSSGLKNSIACMGATLPEWLLDKIPNVVLCYDNDKTGIQNMVNALKKRPNLSALVYPRETNFKDLNEALQKGVDTRKFVEYNVNHGIKALVLLQQLL